MASGKKLRSVSVSSSGGECVLCCEPITAFAVGPCDHPTCFRCSSRMRVLINQKYCAVCRADIPKVVFSDQLKPYSSYTFSKRKELTDRQHGIYFDSMEMRNLFHNLLIFQCCLCDSGVDHQSFDKLRSHMRKEHSRQYCNICVQKLHVFPKEFRTYTRKDLVTHRSVGDADNKSHRGHPECRFCDERFLDDDELLSHLRKHHFWCHFCERDGKQDYYDQYLSLREHFKEAHFLCEEENCKTEEYTAVFRNKLDLQAHIVERHPHGLSKHEAKRQRNVDLQMDYRLERERSAPQVHFNTRGRVRNKPVQVTKAVKANPAADALPPSDPSDLEALYAPKVSPAISRHAAPSEKSHDGGQVEPDFPSLHASSNDQAASSSNPASMSAAVAAVSLDTGKQSPRGNQGRSWNKVLPSMSDADAFPGLPVKEGKTKPSQQRKTQSGSSRATSQVKIKTPANHFPPPGLNKTVTKPPGFADIAKPPGFADVAKPPGFTEITKPSQGTKPKATKERVVAVAAKSNAPGGESSLQERNMRLIQMIQSYLTEEQWVYFRELSARFRRSEIPSKLYYEDMSVLFADNLKKVFSELVSLLPDPAKQEELLEYHHAKKVISTQANGAALVVGSYSEKCKDTAPPSPKPKRSPGLAAKSYSSAPNIATDFPALPIGKSKRSGRTYRTPTHISTSNAWGGK